MQKAESRAHIENDNAYELASNFGNALGVKPEIWSRLLRICLISVTNSMIASSSSGDSSAFVTMAPLPHKLREECQLSKTRCRHTFALALAYNKAQGPNRVGWRSVWCKAVFALLDRT